MALGQLLTHVARTAATNAPIAVGVLGAAGFVGSGGDVQGIGAGITGSIGGGARGAFSGGVIGSLLGMGAVAGAMAVPAFRKRVGTMLHSAMSTGPVRGVESVMRMAGAAGSTSHMNVAASMAAFRSMQPQAAAAAFTKQLLERKRALLIGAVGGGFAGALAGVPLGATRSAYQAGRRQTGPMG